MGIDLECFLSGNNWINMESKSLKHSKLFSEEPTVYLVHSTNTRHCRDSKSALRTDSECKITNSG